MNGAVLSVGGDIVALLKCDQNNLEIYSKANSISLSIKAECILIVLG